MSGGGGPAALLAAQIARRGYSGGGGWKPKREDLPRTDNGRADVTYAVVVVSLLVVSAALAYAFFH